MLALQEMQVKPMKNEMQGKLVLITGGARSGKSEFAENFMRAYTEKTAYIATAEILDEEMNERVFLHKQRREAEFWLNLEAPYNAQAIIEQIPAEVEGILFDCLTIYVCNLLYTKLDNLPFLQKVTIIKQEIAEIIKMCRKSGKLVVFVSNEIGLGIVPANKMAREYRDVIGWINQQVAAECEHVFLTVCGQALDIKKMAFKLPNQED